MTIREDWERIFRTQAWGRYPSESVVRFVARRFYGADDRRAVRLLDLGCGPGACTWFMAREGFSVSGVDMSPTAIAQARARLADERLEADLRVGDIAALPYASGTFDGVIDNCALCCNPVAEIAPILAEVRRVLRPGGAMLSLAFTDRCWGYGTGQALGDGAFTDAPEGPFHNRGLIQFLGRAQIDTLYRDFTALSVETTAWSANAQRDNVELWVIQAEKGAAAR
jgi:SAM-dependent methyltransferase